MNLNSFLACVFISSILSCAAQEYVYRYAGVQGGVGWTESGPATSVYLNRPYGCAFGSDGSLYVSDIAYHVVRRIYPNGTTVRYAGLQNTPTGSFSGDGGPARSAALNEPNGLALDANDNLYIADSRNNRIRIVYASNLTIATFAGE
jgi:internalin A